jgi:hypothetical protein
MIMRTEGVCVASECSFFHIYGCLHGIMFCFYCFVFVCIALGIAAWKEFATTVNAEYAWITLECMVWCNCSITSMIWRVDLAFVFTSIVFSVRQLHMYST